ncbi:AAA family ATPase [Undibacterium jejuense]|uniref:AAA family ATPase n=1 Tax=Undibacterium jejuense TaxID=1344949 RepID=A0A923HJU2_9BURK|nr:AAA family ATPase [Undibacterium jejuense]MBC3863748.1 AAA family ATPase [Undibacterium jejuense]
MKICYIWIEKYRNLENFSLNLSSTTKFNFDSEKNLLTSESCRKLPLDFFGQRIDEVTGLIGKNGSGKSNALSLICNALKNSKSGLNAHFLIITEEDGIQTCHYSFKKNLSQPSANFSIEIIEYVGEVKELKVIYFSNVFNKSRNYFGREVSDISVKNGIFENRVRPAKSDFEKQMILINSRLFRKIDIDLPHKIRFTQKRLSKFSLSSRYSGNSASILVSLESLKDLFRNRLREINGRNRFFHLVRLSYFEYILSLRINADEYSLFLSNAVDFMQGNSNDQKTEEISENLIRFISESFPSSSLICYEKKSSRESEFDLEVIRRQIDFLLKIQENFSSIDIDYSTEGFRNRSEVTFEIAYSQKSKGLIQEFVSLFGESIGMNIDWSGISSGHLAYLNLFSSIYDELKNVRQRSLLLCIDEGDLYLHPFWQVEFFSKLLSVLPEMFRGEIQIVLTSHSPFLLSDLPNQCITILDQHIQGGTMNGIALDEQTFGGNLYDLYAKPFFLGDQKMSKFAYEKIARYLELVEATSGSVKGNPDDISHLIGDEVIRFKLQRLFGND